MDHISYNHEYIIGKWYVFEWNHTWRTKTVIEIFNNESDARDRRDKLQRQYNKQTINFTGYRGKA